MAEKYDFIATDLFQVIFIISDQLFNARIEEEATTATRFDQDVVNLRAQIQERLDDLLNNTDTQINIFPVFLGNQLAVGLNNGDTTYLFHKSLDQ
nr:1815_t:CDS:2 [Entrophospora candida]